MASIRKRSWRTAKGEERTAWILDYRDQHGRRVHATFKTKREASEYQAQAIVEIGKGVHTPKSRSVTVAEAVDRWLDRCREEGLERGTILTYRNLAQYHITPLIGRHRLAELSAPGVAAFRSALLAGGRSHSMVRRTIGTLSMILNHAMDTGLVAQNVLAGGRKKRGNTGARHKERLEEGRQYPGPAEIRAMIEAAPNLHWRALIVTAAFTGLRSSELRGLTWANVDFDKGVVKVRQRLDRWNQAGSPKSAAGWRDVPMAPLVMSTLKEWRLACPRRGVKKGRDGNVIDQGELHLVFPNSKGEPDAHNNWCARFFEPLQIRLGLTSGHKLDDAGNPKLDRKGRPIPKPRFSFHSLRHFCASWLIAMGKPPKRIQAIMGHSSITMTFDVYGHLFAEADDEQAQLAAAERKVMGGPRPEGEVVPIRGAS